MADVWNVGVARIDTGGNLYLNGGISYSGDSVIRVPSSGSATGMYSNLVQSYAKAKALTPNGSPLSSENRAVLILPVGVYDAEGSKFNIDAQYVDIVSEAPVMGGDNILSYQPTNTVIKGTPDETTGIVAEISVDDVKIVGISFVSNTAGTRPLYFSELDGCPNGYFEKVYLYNELHNSNVYDYPDFERSVGGVWVDCIASMRYAWRINPQTSENSDAFFTANMTNCHAEHYSFGGDFVPYSPTGQDNYRFDNARLEGCTTTRGLSGGEASFSGCSEWGIGVDVNTVFIECESGAQSFGLGADFKGSMYRCRGGRICAGGTRLDTRVGEFSGYAEDCHFGIGSFGGQSEDSVADSGVNSGTMINCSINSLRDSSYGKVYLLDGATMTNCSITSLKDGVDLFKVVDSGAVTTKILNSNLEVYPGTARHVVSDVAKDVIFAGCTINNKVSSSTGLGGSVTNRANPNGNGVYNL